ncbi:aa3-type cytochrome c oxidase subunit IV [Salinarimonas chemoclinalis]|uniref:aa3-type cytochrome c oxidase subunit IV n=1 Tax=Salinarimonas chemoclinalis TaxID=3241599 RepID=UPI003558B977
MATMAHDQRNPNEGYRPEMDGETHEQTYDGFIVFTTITSLVVIAWVLALALGGIKEAWLTGILGVVASMIAGGIGALFPRVGWRAPAVVVGLMLVAFVLA